MIFANLCALYSGVSTEQAFLEDLVRFPNREALVAATHKVMCDTVSFDLLAVLEYKIVAAIARDTHL